MKILPKPLTTTEWIIVSASAIIMLLLLETSLEDRHGWFSYSLVGCIAIFLVTFLWNVRKGVRTGVLLALAVPSGPLDAQSTPEPARVTGDFMIHVSMPPLPGEEHVGVIVGACLAGAGLALGGYVIIKIVSACLNRYEHAVTNENNNPLPDPNKLPFYATGEATNSHPTPTGPTPSGGGDCGCDNPAAPGKIAVIVQHSTDLVTWADVTTAPTLGQEIALPASGFWRIVPLRLSIAIVGGQAIVTTPAGILERHAYMDTWEPVVTNSSPATVAVSLGLYRLRQ